MSWQVWFLHLRRAVEPCPLRIWASLSNLLSRRTLGQNWHQYGDLEANILPFVVAICHFCFSTRPALVQWLVWTADSRACGVMLPLADHSPPVMPRCRVPSRWAWYLPRWKDRWKLVVRPLLLSLSSARTCRQKYLHVSFPFFYPLVVKKNTFRRPCDL